MYFNNFMFTIGLLLLLAQHLFSFFVIPHGYDRSDTLISARNKQASIGILICVFNLGDMVMAGINNGVRLNLALCQFGEQVLMLGIGTMLWLEVIHHLCSSARLGWKRRMYCAYILPVLFALPAFFIETLVYKPSPCRTYCLIAAPFESPKAGVAILSLLRAGFSMWIPAHLLVFLCLYKRKQVSQSQVIPGVMGASVCTLLYIGIVWSSLSTSVAGPEEDEWKISYFESNMRWFMLVILSVFTNYSCHKHFEKIAQNAMNDRV